MTGGRSVQKLAPKLNEAVYKAMSPSEKVTYYVEEKVTSLAKLGVASQAKPTINMSVRTEDADVRVREDGDKMRPFRKYALEKMQLKEAASVDQAWTQWCADLENPDIPKIWERNLWLMADFEGIFLGNCSYERPTSIKSETKVARGVKTMQDFDQEFEVIRQKRVQAMTKMPTTQAYPTPMPGKGPDHSLVEGAFKKEDLSTRKVFDDHLRRTLSQSAAKKQEAQEQTLMRLTKKNSLKKSCKRRRRLQRFSMSRSSAMLW